MVGEKETLQINFKIIYTYRIYIYTKNEQSINISIITCPKSSSVPNL